MASYFRYEKTLVADGRRAIAGVDEVGRGALFGPVVAAAVLFPAEFFLKRRPAWAREVRDSKQLLPTKRSSLAAILVREAEALGLGTAASGEIDRINIHAATKLAMTRAIADLGVRPDVVLIDGRPLGVVDYAEIGVPGGDRGSFLIAAASIVAKVFRDRMMDDFDRLYRGYGLGRNKGYGTAEHYRALRERGPTALHRTSFRLAGERP